MILSFIERLRISEKHISVVRRCDAMGLVHYSASLCRCRRTVAPDIIRCRSFFFYLVSGFRFHTYFAFTVYSIHSCGSGYRRAREFGPTAYIIIQLIINNWKWTRRKSKKMMWILIRRYQPLRSDTMLRRLWHSHRRTLSVFSQCVFLLSSRNIRNLINYFQYIQYITTR